MPDKILSLPPVEQMFFEASMVLAIEEYKEKLNAIYGR